MRSKSPKGLTRGATLTGKAGALLLVVFVAVGFAPATALADEGHEHEEGGLAGLIKPMGVATFVFVAATFLMGWLMPKKRRTLFKWHRALAIIAILCALCHGGLVIFFH